MTTEKEEVIGQDTAKNGDKTVKMAEKNDNSDKKVSKKAKAPKNSDKPTVEVDMDSYTEFLAYKKATRQLEAKRAPVIETRSAMDDPIYRAKYEESKMVKGIFRCRQPQGGSVKFCFKKYKGDPIKWYTMFDGEVYTVPLAVARHLNENCGWYVHSHIVDKSGAPLVDQRGKKESRMSFESLEFAHAV